MENIFILDFDDTLFCTSLLNNEEEFQKCSVFDIKINKELNLKLRELENKIIEIFNHLEKIGTIYILTNANKQWVIDSCNKFIPKINDKLSGIKIISACEQYS